MIEGIIIRGVGGNYYVETEKGLVECRARGLFRNQNLKPLVGDYVKVRLIGDNHEYGYVEEILERKNHMKRPPVANVDQIVIVFAITKPEPSYLLLDKLLIAAEANNLKPVICFNKIDLVDDKRIEFVKNIYDTSKYQLIFTSKEIKETLSVFKEMLQNKVTLFSGPSGVGKSSLMNEIDSSFSLKTGDVSEKLKRGKHTTRHAEIYKLSIGGFVVDTPGFSFFDINEIDYKNLADYYPEMAEVKNQCKFADCAHKNEPGCAVKELVKEGQISEVRYNNYVRLYDEIKNANQY